MALTGSLIAGGLAAGGGILGGILNKPKEPQASKDLAAISREQFQNILPLLRGGSQQLQDILASGGLPQGSPVIRGAVESGRVAQSQTLSQAMEALDRAGITGTARTETLLGLIQQGNLDISQIPLNISLPLLMDIFRTTLGQPALASQGLGAAGQIGAQTNIAGSNILQGGISGATDLLGAISLLGGAGKFGGLFGGGGTQTSTQNPLAGR